MADRIATARAAVVSWSQALLSMRRVAIEEGRRAPDETWQDADTIFGDDTGLAMTPAQAPAFFARSAAWRCTSCGKVHAFVHRVPVATASPCSCAGIEFEPHREVVFSDGERRIPGRRNEALLRP